MALDRLTGMLVFRSAVEVGSLTAAARRHGLSAEMASRHLRALETRLGVRLLNRSTRRLAPTEAGHRYYLRCSAVLDEISTADAEAGAAQTEPQGALRIAAPLAFAASALVPAILAYRAVHPGVSLRLDLSEREVDLLGEGFDLALRLGRLPDSGLTARRLARFRLRLLAAPAYLARHPPVTAPGDLSEHETLIYTATATPQRLTLTAVDGRSRSVTLRAALAASDVVFLLECARRGAGLIVAPSFLVEQDVAQGRLLPVLPGWRLRDLPLHALVPHHALMAATVRSFMDSMSAWFLSPPARD